MKKTKRVLAILIGLLLISLSTSALATEVELLKLDDGDITIEMQADGTYSVTKNQKTTSYGSDTSFTVTQSDSSAATGNTLTIKAAGQTAKVTLSGVNIDVSNSGKAAVSTGGDGDVIIELKGKNTVKSGQGHAGVEKGNAGKLTIADDGNYGSLEAVGGNTAAGIGGGVGNNGSNITISGGEVKATGGNNGAGIGGGLNGSGSGIAISGGEVKATGGQLGAGIGGGEGGSGSGITISGGEVNATGGRGGAGIGGGHKGSGNNIAFSGKVKATVQGGVGDQRYYGAGAGIGNGGSFSNGNPVDGDDLYQTSKLLDVSGLKPGAIIRCYKQGTGIPDSLLYEIPELPDEKVVEVKCITENSGHAEKTYKLIAGSYDFGEVQGDTCEITVKPEKYVAQYNSDIGVEHKLDLESQPGKIKLEWDNQKWKLVTPSDVPVVFFYVKCEKTPPENPAKLTSFVKSRVTAITDDMSTLLPKGVTFNTAPKVTFDANNTTANLLYSFTVTGTPGAEVTITDMGAKFYNNGNWVENNITVTLPTPTEGAADYVTYTVYGYRQFTKNDIDDKVLKNTATAGVEGSEELVPGKATVPAEDKTGSGPSESPEPSPSTNPNPTPTPTPGGGNGGGGNGGGGHSHCYPTTTPVPGIVIPPKTGDMTIWQSILHFLGIR